MPPTSPKTKSARRKLSEVAKHLSVPDGITSSEWPAAGMKALSRSSPIATATSE